MKVTAFSLVGMGRLLSTNGCTDTCRPPAVRVSGTCALPCELVPGCRSEAGVDAESGVVDGSVMDASVVDVSLEEAGTRTACGYRLDLCRGNCFDLQTNPRNCGQCGRVCPAPSNAEAQCRGGMCQFECSAGSVLRDGQCVAGPRPRAPLSQWRVRTARPTLQWIAPRDGERVRVEVCRDRECAMRVFDQSTTETSVRLATPLARGTYFWRVSTATVTSPVWELVVNPAARDTDRTLPGRLDFDGDGRADFMGGVDVIGTDNPAVCVWRGALTGTASVASITSIRYTPFPTKLAVGAGDMDGDGLSEIYAYTQTDDGHFAWYPGRVRDFPLNANIFPVRVHELAAEFSSPTRIDDAIASSLGDFNNDGFVDGLVIAMRTSNAPTSAILQGSSRGPRFPLTAHNSLSSIDVGPGMPRVRELGDIDGDGSLDAVFLAPEPRKVVLLSGSATGAFRTQNFVLTDGASPNVEWSGVSSGDLNGDGFEDLVLLVESQLRIVFGGTAISATLPPPVASFGATTPYSVSARGDLNGDGFDDVAVSVLTRTSSDSFEVWIFRGSPNGIASEPNQKITVNSPIVVEGAVAIPGDITGDNVDDLVVGVPGFINQTGIIQLYSGGERVSAMPVRDYPSCGSVLGNAGRLLEPR